MIALVDWLLKVSESPKYSTLYGIFILWVSLDNGVQRRSRTSSFDSYISSLHNFFDLVQLVDYDYL